MLLPLDIKATACGGLAFTTRFVFDEVGLGVARASEPPPAFLRGPLNYY